MIHSIFQKRLAVTVALVLLGLCASAIAQEKNAIVPIVVANIKAAAAAAESVLGNSGANTDNAVPSTETPSAIAVAAVPPAAEGCRPVTEKAMANDIKAAQAQTQSGDLTDQLKLLEDAVALWSSASTQCEGRAKERAQRNLMESQRVRNDIKDQLGSGAQCLSAQKDAVNLQEMAKKALADRRYNQSSVLFKKAGDNWDVASELCTGDAQRISETRRDQSEIDGHNAENCAPLFEKAREQTIKFRSAAAGMTREEKQDTSQIVETLWRDAASRCKGDVVSTANGNAQSISRDRGTPWVAKVMPAPAPTAVKKEIASVAAVGVVLRPVVTSTFQASEATTSQPTTRMPSNQQQATVAPVAMIYQPQPVEFEAEGTRYSGKFVIDASGLTYSGTGKISWPSGDVFDGTLVDGRRNGSGLAVWKNGQRYSGDWVDDKQTGTASVRFSNGDQYEGLVVDGKPHGQGRMLYASGDSYSGQFNAGTKDGRGIYIWKSGQKFDGEWKNQSPDGKGRMEFASGEIYEGQFLNGSPEGMGAYKWPSGDHYVGGWKNGKKHGQGTFAWKSGDRWDGVYENDAQKTGELTRKIL